MDNTADIQVVERKVGYQGYFRLDVYRLRHRLHAGGWSDEISREVLERGHAAAALLYDPARDAVVTIEQFRAGAYAAGRPAWLREVVAGIIEPGETAADVARRESIEEAGCEVRELRPICSYVVTPGCCSETIQLFLGIVDSSRAGGIHGLKEEHEDIRVIVQPWAEARADLDAGRIDNATAIIALQWLALHRDEVRKGRASELTP
jgi:ADP-ribose pyrophosphatase